MNRKTDLTFAGLVHDLNNVFQTIIDAAELVGSHPELVPIAAIIQRSVDHGRHIAASMAAQEQGAAPLDSLVCQAAAFASDVAAAMKGPRLEFARDIPPGLVVLMPASSLERVLMNLFINAAQAAKAAGRETCCIAVSAREDGDRALFEVADDGPGINAGVLPAIFEPGFSTDGARTGLGLHIVHSLIAEAGGTVSASNRQSRGAAFSMDLPVARPMEAVSR